MGCDSGPGPQAVINAARKDREASAVDPLGVCYVDQLDTMILRDHGAVTTAEMHLQGADGGYSFSPLWVDEVSASMRCYFSVPELVVREIQIQFAEQQLGALGIRFDESAFQSQLLGITGVQHAVPSPDWRASLHEYGCRPIGAGGPRLLLRHSRASDGFVRVHARIDSNRLIFNVPDGRTVIESFEELWRHRFANTFIRT